MSGTTVRTESNVVSMLDRLVQGESSGTAPPESGTLRLPDGRQLTVSLVGPGQSLGPLLDLVMSRTSHAVAERIIRNMGVHAGQPLNRETIVHLRQETVAAFEQANLEAIARLLGDDPRGTMLRELERIDPRLAAELLTYGSEIDVFTTVFVAMPEDEARRSARRGEEMREDTARVIAERVLQDRRFRKAPLGSPQQLARAIQHWSNQKGRAAMRETMQRIETEVRDGGPSFARLSEMVRQQDEQAPMEPPYTSQSIARRLSDELETLLRGGSSHQR